ncbi:MAG: hypothetical protein QOH26_727, partial [Actinomycetota bacterium]|nr:hypothetical protein [Actinomycetota bacterium]
MPEFKLPDLGEGVTEAEIDRWLVKEGDEIEEDAPLVEVITDKATAEIPSPFAGRVTRIHVPEGEVVPVGSVLVTVSAPGEETAAPAAASAGPRAVAPPPPPIRPIAPMPQPDIAMEVRVKAMPPVRKLARSLGVELGSIRGSGPGGRVLREDVELYAANGRNRDQTPSRSGGRREALRGVRRKIAERMTEAHRIVPPVTHVEECDVTELEATRALANERAPESPRLTFMPFIVKAVVAGLKEYEALNASLDEEAGEIVFHDRYDIGIAVDTPAGLTVVVV